MNNQQWQIPAIIFGTILILGSICTVLNQKACYSQWDDSRYSLNSGCMVNVKGTYIPAKNVRVIKWENVE